MAHHCVVIIFVIQLQDFNKVMESSLVLRILACLVHWEHIGFFKHLLSLLSCSSNLFNSLQSWVQVAGTNKIPGIECVNISISLEVVHIEGELDGVN